MAHVVKTLLRMHIAPGSDPRRRVKGGAEIAAVAVPPLHRKGNGVLGIEALRLCDASRAQGRDRFRSGQVFDGPVMKIDMMGVEVVTDVAGFARPCPEGFELRLGLTHVGVEKTKIAELPNLVPGVDIDGIPTLVQFHRYQHALPLTRCDQSLMIRNGLHDGFGDERM